MKHRPSKMLPKTREIVERRKEGSTLKEIADAVGMTPEGVRVRLLATSRGAPPRLVQRQKLLARDLAAVAAELVEWEDLVTQAANVLAGVKGVAS